MKNKEIKKEVKEVLQANYGDYFKVNLKVFFVTLLLSTVPAILGTITSLGKAANVIWNILSLVGLANSSMKQVIQSVTDLSSSVSTISTVLTPAFSLVQSVMSLIFAYGIANVSLGVATKFYVDNNRLFNHVGGFKNILRYIGISVRLFFKCLLPTLLATVLTGGGIAIGASMDNTILAAGLSILMMFIGSLLMACLINRFAMTYYIALENPEMKGKDCIKESVRLMKGKSMQLYWLEFSYTLLSILSVFLLYIPAYVIFIPRKNVARAIMYAELSKSNMVEEQPKTDDIEFIQ